MTRGRILAIDGDIASVRGERADVRVGSQSSWRAGDLIDCDSIVRSFGGGDYPSPQTEVARLSRARLTALQARANALTALRGFFAARDFIEVETPLLVPSPGLEIHLDAVAADGGWLITSPEYQMKRLLAAGFERIYQVCKCFRRGEYGPHHASEFTMVEWYRGFATLDAILGDTQELVAHEVRTVRGTAIARVGGRSIDVTPPWPRMTVREAMVRWAGVDVAGDESAEALVRAVRAAGVEIADGTAWDDAFFAAFLARVDPAIAGLDRPLILEDWPAPLRRSSGCTSVRGLRRRPRARERIWRAYRSMRATCAVRTRCPAPTRTRPRSLSDRPQTHCGPCRGSATIGGHRAWFRSSGHARYRRRQDR